MRAFIITLALSGSLAVLVHGQDVLEPLALEKSADQLIEGSVDWTNQLLTVYGEGIAPENITNPVRRRLMGFRAAKVEARRNLLEMVGEVHIDAQTTVSMAMVESDDVRSRLTGIVKGARVVTGSQSETDGLYRIALQIDLRHEFAETVLPDHTRPQDTETLPVVADSLTDSLQVYIPPEPYTSLLVDARARHLVERPPKARDHLVHALLATDLPADRIAGIAVVEQATPVIGELRRHRFHPCKQYGRDQQPARDETKGS